MPLGTPFFTRSPDGDRTPVTSLPDTSRAADAPTPDFVLANHGTIYLLHPESTEAFLWADEYLPENCPRHGTAYAIETRFIARIVTRALSDGLVLIASPRSWTDFFPGKDRP